jgi:hypothetical protein
MARLTLFCSRGLVDKEGDVIILCESEVNESVTLVHSVASETLSEEDVPVRLPLIVHVLLYNARNLENKFKLVTAERPMNALTSTPSSSNSCSSRAFFATRITSSSISSGIAGGHSTSAYTNETTRLMTVKYSVDYELTPLNGFLIFLFSSLII